MEFVVENVFRVQNRLHSSFLEGVLHLDITNYLSDIIYLIVDLSDDSHKAQTTQCKLKDTYLIYKIDSRKTKSFTKSGAEVLKG